MAKKIVDVDEDTLKGMIIGDMPVFGRKQETPSDFLGEEKDITPGEVEDTLSTEHPYVPSEEELYEDEER